MIKYNKDSVIIDYPTFSALFCAAFNLVEALNPNENDAQRHGALFTDDSAIACLSLNNLGVLLSLFNDVKLNLRFEFLKDYLYNLNLK